MLPGHGSLPLIKDFAKLLFRSLKGPNLSTMLSILGIGTSIQAQTYQRFTTGGTSTAYTLTPSPALAANAAGSRLRVVFNAAAGATPTLAVSGLAALPLQFHDPAGALKAVTSTQVPLNWVADVECTGTVWVVLNVAAQLRPSFMANRGSTQSIPNASATKIQYNNPVYDVGGVYDPTTNFRYTPTVAGVYLVVHSFCLTAGVDQSAFISAVYKNGSPERAIPSRFSGAGGEGLIMTYQVLMNGTTDYLEAYGTQTSGGAINLDNTTSFFSASLVSP